MSHPFDAIVIGAGHNGLTCGCYLARAGLKVLVLEQTPVSNVYLCGSGSHPGPGVSMAPGRNAAQVILKDLGINL